MTLDDVSCLLHEIGDYLYYLEQAAVTVAMVHGLDDDMRRLNSLIYIHMGQISTITNAVDRLCEDLLPVEVVTG